MTALAVNGPSVSAPARTALNGMARGTTVKMWLPTCARRRWFCNSVVLPALKPSVGELVSWKPLKFCTSSRR